MQIVKLIYKILGMFLEEDKPPEDNSQEQKINVSGDNNIIIIQKH